MEKVMQVTGSQEYWGGEKEGMGVGGRFKFEQRNEVKELTRWPPGGRVFQAVRTACAKVLGWSLCLMLEEHHED